MSSLYKKAVTRHETDKEFNKLVEMFQKLMKGGIPGRDLYDALALARIIKEEEEKVKV